MGKPTCLFSETVGSISTRASNPLASSAGLVWPVMGPLVGLLLGLLCRPLHSQPPVEIPAGTPCHPGAAISLGAFWCPHSCCGLFPCGASVTFLVSYMTEFAPVFLETIALSVMVAHFLRYFLSIFVIIVHMFLYFVFGVA